MNMTPLMSEGWRAIRWSTSPRQRVLILPVVLGSLWIICCGSCWRFGGINQPGTYVIAFDILSSSARRRRLSSIQRGESWPQSTLIVSSACSPLPEELTLISESGRKPWLHSSPSQLLIQWKGEDVEGYSIGFRVSELQGSLEAMFTERTNVDTLTTNHARPDNMQSTLKHGLSARELEQLLRFDNALRFAGDDKELSPIKSLRFNQALQYISWKANVSNGFSNDEYFHSTTAIVAASLLETMSRQVWIDVVRRCALVRALYEVVAWGPDETSLSEAALVQGTLADLTRGSEHEHWTWCVRVHQFGEAAASSRRTRHGVRRTGSVSYEQAALNQLKPVLLTLGGRVNLDEPDCPLYVMRGLLPPPGACVDVEDDGESRNEGDKTVVVLARQLAVGAKTSILAPRTRICVTNTPLCPLAAYIACNVARVKDHHRVLDPFCGSGTLLLAAASIAPQCVAVGIELAHDGFVNRQHVMEDFFSRNLTAPAAFIRGDSFVDNVRARALSAIANSSFDAIITDPPYGIRESINSFSSHVPTDTQKAPWLEFVDCLARDRKNKAPLLKLGGRFVCFIPCQSDQELEDVLPTREQLKDAGLELEYLKEQPLHDRLSRWLASYVRVC